MPSERASETVDDPMPSWIEFHDSELVAATRVGPGVSILLDAYVHRWDDGGDRRKGTGWKQQIRLTVGKGVGIIPVIASRVCIFDGELAIGQVVHRNLVRLPIESTEAIGLRIQLATGEALEISGQSIHLECLDEARYVEELPAELWPGTPE